MKIVTKVLSSTFLFVITLTVFGSVISANLQDHSKMMDQGGCADAEECIFHQARIVFENNVLSNTVPLQLAVLLIVGSILFVSVQFNSASNLSKFLSYVLKLIKYRDKWIRYLQRSIDRLKVQPLFFINLTY